MQVTKITAFQTSDAKIFETQSEADKHELDSYISRTLSTIASRMYCHNLSEDDLITHLNAERDALRELFQHFERASKTLNL